MQKTKLMLLVWLCFCVIVPLLYAGAIIIDFRAEPGFNKVALKWSSQNEVNLKGFEVQRGFEKNNFKEIGFVKAITGQQDKKNYSYEDKTVFKQTSRNFFYRLKIMDKDGSFTYSKEISATPTISSARQTWGSIKAMFR
ncbi:MAG: hypothetical protein ACE5HO_13905 [bacterium]